MLPLRSDRVVVVGVLNVTPDSFSDGGRYVDRDDAVAHGLRMHADGADLVDVGGESTRPGAERVDADEEIRRVLPDRDRTRRRGRAGVDRHLPRGGGRGGAGRRRVRGQRRVRRPRRRATWCGSCATPVARGSSCTGAGTARRCSSSRRYDDVVADVRAELSYAGRRRRRGRRRRLAAGDRPGPRVRQDRGAQLGAAARAAVAGRGRAAGAGGRLAQVVPRVRCCATASGPRPVDDREDATTAITAYCALNGAWGVRVHEVRPAVDAALTVAAICTGSGATDGR